jgi:phytanoyl-CoA hydroxylase
MASGTAVPVATSFAQDGYVVLPDLFSASEIAPISDEIDRLLEGKVNYVPEHDLIWEPNSNPPRLRNAFRLHLYSDFFLQVATTPALVEAVRLILGTPLRLYGGQLFAKPAGVGTEVPAHQDMPYWPFAPYEMLTAWIALDDSTIENGCVRMTAGSHKVGILPHEASGVVGNSLGLREHPSVQTLPEHVIEVKRGSCVLHHCLTVHRSDPNTSIQPRRGLTYVYMSPNVELVDPERMRGPAVFPVVD